MAIGDYTLIGEPKFSGGELTARARVQGFAEDAGVGLFCTSESWHVPAGRAILMRQIHETFRISINRRLLDLGRIKERADPACSKCNGAGVLERGKLRISCFCTD